MSFKITKALESHLIDLKNSGAFPDIPKDQLAAQWLSVGVAFAVQDELDQTMCAGGVIPMWKGVGLLWLAMNESFRKSPKTLLYATKSIIEMVEKAGGFHRLQMYIDADNRRDINFADILGFTFEGTMHKHKPDGSDHLLFAKF